MAVECTCGSRCVKVTQFSVSLANERSAQIGNLEKGVKGKVSCEGGLVNGILCRGLVAGVL